MQGLRGVTMVNEREEHYEEEGEYHFSDDQVNYDIEPEASKETQKSAFSKEALLEKYTQHRRKIFGVISLIVLIGIVYKMLVPASTPPTTEFSQTAASVKAEKPAVANAKTPPAAAQPATPASTVAPVSQPSSAPASATTTAATSPSAPIPVTSTVATVAAPAPGAPASSSAPPQTQDNKPVVPVNAQQNPPPVAGTITVLPPTASQTAAQGASVQQPNVVYAPPQTMPPSAQVTAPASPSMPPMNVAQPGVDTQIKDRITALEQQNTAMMNLLQTEYAQKIADTETQANAVRGKMDELTKRVNRMEASLTQITQLLQGVGRSQSIDAMGGAPVSIPSTAARSAEPRMTYSVQAIIPGRAWLKSESGDTVTVAEGDYLKKYGRVTKIDPYDGVVAIDTGSKVITLSYGVDGE